MVDVSGRTRVTGPIMSVTRFAWLHEVWTDDASIRLRV